MAWVFRGSEGTGVRFSDHKREKQHEDNLTVSAPPIDTNWTSEQQTYS
jgi:hypothetical protein